MTKHKKRKRDIHRETHDDDVNKTQDSISDNIPLDLIFEILSRLPAKSILRFRCVSKLWSSFTKIQSFINLFTSRSSTQPSTLLITLSEKSKQSVILFPQPQDQSKSCSSIYKYQTTYQNPFKYTLSESVHGLILVDIFKIWNPSLRRLLTIPHPNENMQSFKFCFLGYDPLERKHKLLCLSGEEYSEPPRVLTLGTQESWRKITKTNHMHSPNNSHGRCFNGIIYYEAHMSQIDNTHIIMSFDVKYETFDLIRIPNSFNDSVLAFHMIHFQGKLALVKLVNKIDLYIMKDASGNDWTHLQFHKLPYMSELNITSFYCKGITDDGQIIFAPIIISKSSYILYFDPKESCIRKAWFEEIVKGNRYQNEFIFMNVFPNYIESLVSF